MPIVPVSCTSYDVREYVFDSITSHNIQSLTRVIHPTLAARVVLHARQQAHQDTCTYQTTGVLSTVDIM
jgi:hypothetical protein